MPEQPIFHSQLKCDEPEGAAAPNGLSARLRSHAMYDARSRRYIAWELGLAHIDAHF